MNIIIMYCNYEDEFEWLMNMLKKGNCFSKWDDVTEFMDGYLQKLRYMKKTIWLPILRSS